MRFCVFKYELKSGKWNITDVDAHLVLSCNDEPVQFKIHKDKRTICPVSAGSRLPLSLEEGMTVEFFNGQSTSKSGFVKDLTAMVKDDPKHIGVMLRVFCIAH